MSALSPRHLLSLLKHEALVNMVQTFFSSVYKLKHGTLLPAPLEKNIDTMAVYYSKREIDDLFRSNGCDDTNSDQYGIRVYFGMHDDNPIQNRNMPNRPNSYIGKMTTILVCIKGDKNDGEEMLIEPGSSSTDNNIRMALDEGHICPPPGKGKVHGYIHI